MSDVKSVITQVANSLGVDPYLALAIAQVESGFNATATGDNGTSYGLYQLHRGGELGALSPTEAYNPETNARVALSVVAQQAQAHPTWSPGQIAAAAQRPANPTQYAASVNAAYAQLKGQGLPTASADSVSATQTSWWNPLSGITGILGSIGHFFSILTDAHFWIRVGEGALAVVVIVIGFIWLNRKEVTPAIADAAKAAAL